MLLPILTACLHGLGDHAENSFSLDGQPITDQQSKVFSNQIPLDAVQSMTVIAGAPSAEYGDKTSLVIAVTTRSGLGVTTPHGDITTSYGTFGTSNVDADFSYGGKNWGNFIAGNVLNTGRFLDRSGVQVFHDHGNEENVFDRVDYVLSETDALHLNFQFTRSWFQTPNSYDQEFHDINGTLALNPLTGVPLGPTDQRSKILTFNIAPTWTHTLSQQCHLQSHRLRAARRLQLLPQQRSFQRSWRTRSPAANRRPAAHASEWRRACKC